MKYLLLDFSGQHSHRANHLGSKLRSHQAPDANAPVNWEPEDLPRAREFGVAEPGTRGVPIRTPLSGSKPRAPNSRPGVPEGAVWPPGV